ncbi:restriction endonuclease subunit S [Polaribacter atrinae]|uniref:restriction endonuclease subunit S n=1 Tax=Polaribacter atrinae TaxID=1333662 RepID=UPI00249096DC|nr:restriction endonuclease subunit S [Polaribacter atrinae]
MSYLDSLLEGVQVEWKNLEDVAKFRRGSFPQPYGKTEWYDGEGAMPFVQVVDVGFDMQLVENTKNKISKIAQPKSVFVPKGTIIVTLQGSIGRVAVTQYDCYVDRTLAIFEYYLIEINEKYFAYQLEEKFRIERINAPGSTIKTITKAAFSKFKIPIPCPNYPEKSLKIQKEIVRVLDTFTELVTELTTELTARKKQYNYYREQLLTFDEREVKHLPMGDKSLGEFIRGGGLQKKDFTDSGVGCIHYGQIYTHYGTYTNKTKSFVSEEFAKKARIAKNGDLVIATTSENDEDLCKAVAWLGNEDIAVSSDACFYRHNLDPKYVAYFFQTEQFHKQKRSFITGAKVRRVNASNLEKFKIPVPSPEEQERIVTILDKFDTLTTSISEGLPKEIDLRKKQYEYYREMLLTFPKPE